MHKNDLANYRLIDKVLPQLARLPPEFGEACSQGKFMQADASRSQSYDRIFSFSSGGPPKYVFNCGGETRHSQDPSIYELRSTQLSKNLAAHCASLTPRPVLVEFSTGMVYKSPSSSTISSGGCSETAQLKPWLKLTKAKLAAEEALAEMAKEGGLNYCTLRLPHVYGPYDVGFLSRGLCLARVYQHWGKEMKWLWGPSLRVNTVHVDDVCTAAWSLAQWSARNPPSPTASSASLLSDRAFNIVDDGDTSQQTLTSLVHSIFDIKTGFLGTVISHIAKHNMDNVVDEINEDILQPWADLLKAKGLEGGQGSPLSPFMEKELLKDADLCLNGRKARELLEWKCQVPRLTEEGLREVIESYEKVGWWP